MELDRLWEPLPANAKQFLNSTVEDYYYLFDKLISFWSVDHPTPLYNQSKTMCVLCGNSWILALHYLKLGDYLLARNLLLSGSILQEAYYTPMSRIIATINDVGYTTTTQAYRSVPRFLTAIEAVATLETMHSILIHAKCQTTRVSTLVTRRD